MTLHILVDACAREAGWPKPEREYQFHPTRRWRFDLAWPAGVSIMSSGGSRPLASPLAVEIQGGIWTGGKHGRGSGIVKDYEKLNTAQSMGWRVLQLTPAQVRAGHLMDWLKKMAV